MEYGLARHVITNENTTTKVMHPTEIKQNNFMIIRSIIQRRVLPYVKLNRILAISCVFEFSLVLPPFHREVQHLQVVGIVH